MSEELLLTVSQSKRLIARGIKYLPSVKRALRDGVVAIAKGTTNRYVAEELLSTDLGNYPYANAITAVDWERKITLGQDIPEVILVRGQQRKISLPQALMLMKRGDVFIKGGNALNYHEGKVGILSGTLDGGTIGRLVGSIMGRRVALLLPIGLEKTIHEDIDEVSRRLQKAGTKLVLFSVRGEIFTEIEALRVLTGVDSYPFGSGGVCGAEGSVRLLVQGSPKQVQATRKVANSLRDEKPYGWYGYTPDSQELTSSPEL